VIGRYGEAEFSPVRSGARRCMTGPLSIEVIRAMRTRATKTLIIIGLLFRCFRQGGAANFNRHKFAKACHESAG